MMSKRRITITVDPDIDDWLQVGANTYGRSMSELVRICLREFSEEHPNRFLTKDKARTKTPESWRIVWKESNDT